MNANEPFNTQYVEIHGHKRAYRMGGKGPVLLLLHGLGRDSSTWKPVMAKLAEHYTVIAPDFLGHGKSDKPLGDYSVGGFANGMRDLLTVLGVDRATVVGHSFGGGVAMQFAYQYPERVERVVLVSTGGLGSEVSPMIRALTLPGAGMVIRAFTTTPLAPFVTTGLHALSKFPATQLRDLSEVARIAESMKDPAAIHAVRRVTSGVVDWRKQLVTMNDRAYLAQLIPVQFIWGRDDAIVPVHHVESKNNAYAKNARITIFDDCGHFPHRDYPDYFVEVVDRFMSETKPARFSRGRWKATLRHGQDVPDLQIVKAR